MTDSTRASGLDWLVGIGSSAGGVEALREMLPGLVDGSVAYLIAQHMSPVHPSLLLQVLARETTLDIAEIANDVELLPGTVYICPPNSDVEVVSGRFVTRQAEPRISPQPSIDVLLASVAEEVGARSIAVILSGTGSDGARGAEMVRMARGRTIAQDPATARYRDMPTAAIDAGVIEFIRSPREIGPLVASIMRGEEPERSGGRFAGDPVMNALAREARRVTGWDLAAYKDGTLGRQLEKRFRALGLRGIDEYLEYVEHSPLELSHLRDSMLINVTSFLRDRAAYDALAHALASALGDKPRDEPLRAWVAGCATGEEAYSIAMLLAEVNRDAGSDRGVKVFATDISDAAMDTARRGAYHVSALKNVPADWVHRYFTVDDDRALVSKQLRDMLVIARQDITRDPPLVRMDLVSCRNLLIYLMPEVQQQVIANLHAALNPGGLLFLGRSESIPGDSDLFTVLSSGNRVYQRGAGPGAARYSAPTFDRSPALPGRSAPTRVPREAFKDDIRDRLLADFGPPSVLIDPSGVPIHQIGAVHRYLTLPDGDGDFTVTSMILPALRTEVSTLISRLNREGGPTATHPVVVRFDNGSHESITIHASRLTPPGASQPYLLLSFVPSPAPVTAPDPDLLEGGDGSDVELLRAQVAALDHELSGTREHLQAVVEELESSNEELQAMNEELQASAEELQATNEELETTNEELQATNEELTTVNETLQVRTVELTDTNEVLHAIQEAVHTAIVLVDNEQRVLQFSPLAVKVFGLVRGDVGLPLRGLPAHVDVPDLSEVVQGVIESGTGQALEVATTSAVYLLQVMPYRVANSTQGAVLAFSDITELAHARRELAVRGEEFRVLAEAVPYALYRSTVDRSRMLYLSATAETLLGLPTDQWAGVRLADFVHPDDRDRVVGAFADVVGDASVDYRIIVPGGAERVIRDISHVTGAGADATRVGALVDITDLVTARAQADTLWRRAEGVFALGGIPGAWVGPDARIREANRFLAALLHTDLAGLLDRPLLDVVSAQDRPRVQAAMDRIVSGAARVEQVPATLSAAVGPRVGLLTLACVSPDDTEGKAMLVTVHDATAERLALKQLEDSEHKLDAVFQGSGAPMAIMSGAGVVIRPNQALCDLLGYGPDELTGAHLDEFTHPDDLAVDQVLFAQLLDGRRRGYTVDKRYLAADGRVIWTRLTVNRGTAGPGDPIIVGSVLDITAEREREAHALVRAQSDPLTGLANRMLAFDRLRQSVRRAGRTGEAVSVLFIDLNGFKGVNDRLGHEVGDLVIRTMAERIAGVTRDSDTVARVGGDEFLVVAPHEGTDSSAEALHLAHRVLDAISLPVDLPASDRSPERTTSLTASIGLAQCPMDGTDVEELVRKADVAMYSAKHAGGNNVSVYSARLVDESRLMATLRADVIEGIRGGEFVPFYQPIVDAGSGAVRALEVLARWRHPERGVLSPAEFIDLVISFNQIEAFTASIIEQAVRDAGSFRAAQEGLSISLNLDPMQLRGSDVPGLLAQLLGPDLTGWTVEVTERAALGDDVAVYRALTELRGTGAKISLDDFGTGYSSVLHLKAWAFDEVKIDREFVSDVGEPGVRGLVATMVDMAHALGARAVAEGVESDAQAEVLRGMGVDLLQGYLFARPMPADELVAWFAEMSSR